MELDDLELGNAVSEVDEFLLQFIIKNKFPALLASSVILARLLWLNKQANTTEDFSKLLGTISDGMVNQKYDLPKDRKLH
jgi:hypothetical protein